MNSIIEYVFCPVCGYDLFFVRVRFKNKFTILANNAVLLRGLYCFYSNFNSNSEIKGKLIKLHKHPELSLVHLKDLNKNIQDISIILLEGTIVSRRDFPFYFF
jgi:hypothetical protein